MILHVAVLDKFIPPFITLAREEFKDEDHQFWLSGSIEAYPVERNDDVYLYGGSFFGKIKSYVRLVRQLHAARKVILHGLFDIRVIQLLALCPWVLSKCYWVIWGGDLYEYKKARRYCRSETLRRFVIRRIGHLVTYVEGDVALARQWYGAKGVHHECLMYISNVVDPAMLVTPTKKQGDGSLNILVGNSAAPSNNHLEALERLLPYKDDDIRIFVPLSYGNQDHAKKVIALGKMWFGDKLVPMIEFIPFEKYIEFLKNIDVAIFNHRRQQAMGNTISLLGMGKTIFMRSDVSQWVFLRDLGLKVFSVENFILKNLDSQSAKDNAAVVFNYFSKEVLIKQYSMIFEG